MKYKMIAGNLLCELLNDCESKYIELIGDDCLLTDEERRAGQRIRYDNKSADDGTGIILLNQPKKLKVIASGSQYVEIGDVIIVKDCVWDESYDDDMKKKVYYVKEKDIKAILPKEL